MFLQKLPGFMPPFRLAVWRARLPSATPAYLQCQGGAGRRSHRPDKIYKTRRDPVENYFRIIENPHLVEKKPMSSTAARPEKSDHQAPVAVIKAIDGQGAAPRSVTPRQRMDAAASMRFSHCPGDEDGSHTEKIANPPEKSALVQPLPDAPAGGAPVFRARSPAGEPSAGKGEKAKGAGETRPKR